eukprot:160782_1
MAAQEDYVHDRGRFVSRSQVFKWLHELLDLDITKVEDLHTGAPHCQVFDLLYPDLVPMNLVDFNAKFNYQWKENWRILEKVMQKVDAGKHVPIADLMKGTAKDTLEFTQWVFHYFHTHKTEELTSNYKPAQRRKMCKGSRRLTSRKFKRISSTGYVPRGTSRKSDVSAADGSHPDAVDKVRSASARFVQGIDVKAVSPGLLRRASTSSFDSKSPGSGRPALNRRATSSGRLMRAQTLRSSGGKGKRRAAAGSMRSSSRLSGKVSDEPVLVPLQTDEDMKQVMGSAADAVPAEQKDETGPDMKRVGRAARRASMTKMVGMVAKLSNEKDEYKDKVQQVRELLGSSTGQGLDPAIQEKLKAILSASEAT